MKGPLGLIANPASGKDIRRLVAHASVFGNNEKSNIIRRAIAGAVAVGVREFLYMPDDHLLVDRALDGLTAAATPADRDQSTAAQRLRPGLDFTCQPVLVPGTGTALDTVRAAQRLREAGCGALLTLGGDGTNRAVALGWRDAPLMAVSTGTNNVFPHMIEATVAGAAAGLVATGALALEQVAQRAKVVDVVIEAEGDQGPVRDLALIDAVLVAGAFTGAKAVWDARLPRLAVLTRAEPAAVGFSAIGGLLHPLSPEADGALLLRFGGVPSLNAPIAPGLYQPVAVAEVRPLALGETAVGEGPGVLALDGERERLVPAGGRARLTVQRDGPWVIDAAAALRLSAKRGLWALPALQR